MQEHKISIRVRYAETDQMGVVYHGNYAQYFEMGRVEWLRNKGISYKELEKSGVMLPVVSLSMNYKKPAFYDDDLTVVTKMVFIGGVKIEFTYEIYNQNHDLLTTAHTVLVFVDMQTKRPIAVPDFLMELVNN
ncbi:acyl-CoA thioesterase [Paenimyroides aestuarii]|uniref:Acyl-CoA thioesterase n=1 Tax=Paenimyroides aestuarii TaxID=2968490 RepID=A0ABY5NSB8_9FLAO|nr:thioesterase family protein [Paenimyroides aestuarii]UUV21475.1 acyl-CoA thioesterase [Paenimyroides aestuarii]